VIPLGGPGIRPNALGGGGRFTAPPGPRRRLISGTRESRIIFGSLHALAERRGVPAVATATLDDNRFRSSWGDGNHRPSTIPNNPRGRGAVECRRIPWARALLAYRSQGSVTAF